MNLRRSFVILSINCFVLLMMLLVPAIIFDILKTNKANLVENPKASLPIYEDENKAKTVWQEYDTLVSKPPRYTSFIGWRYPQFNSKYTNIENRYYTRRSDGEALEASTWFFGGSTMWGNGVADHDTIPSLYHKITGNKVMNFGELGYESRQSLNQFINLIADGHRPKTVIFYEGFNDLGIYCFSGTSALPQHGENQKIQSALLNKDNALRSFSTYIARPYLSILARIPVNLQQKNLFICDTDVERASLAVQHTLTNWQIAHKIAEQHGIKFLAIYQPSLAVKGEIPEYLLPGAKQRAQNLKQQAAVIHPLLFEELRKIEATDPVFAQNVIDGTNWLSSASGVYIDECHLTKAGNLQIAEKIVYAEDNKE